MKSRVHPKYKTKYRVGNWPAYDRALVQRGDVTLWLTPEAIARWEAAGVGKRGDVLVDRRRWPCASGRHQVSLTSGTVLHNTKLPLTQWFWAAYLMTTATRGISALGLQRQLGLSRYETAWLILHKLRRAMVNAARAPLHGAIEVDDTWIGGPQPGLRGSRQLNGRRAALVLVAVEQECERNLVGN